MQKSIHTIRTKRGEARVETTGNCAGQPFGINKSTRRLRKTTNTTTSTIGAK